MDKYSIENFRAMSTGPLILGIFILGLLMFLSPEIMSLIFIQGLLFITVDRFEEVDNYNQVRYNELQV